MANEFVTRNGLISLGGVTFPRTVCSSTYSVLSTDYFVECSSGFAFVVTIPTAVGIVGKLYAIKNSGTGLVTVSTTSSQLIYGVTTSNL